MQKIEMVIYGKRALIDADQVNLHVKKQQLISDLKLIDKYRYNHTDNDYMNLVGQISGKLARLNRRIRKNVQFI